MNNNNLIRAITCIINIIAYSQKSVNLWRSSLDKDSEEFKKISKELNDGIKHELNILSGEYKSKHYYIEPIKLNNNEIEIIKKLMKKNNLYYRINFNTVL